MGRKKKDDDYWADGGQVEQDSEILNNGEQSQTKTSQTKENTTDKPSEQNGHLKEDSKKPADGHSTDNTTATVIGGPSLNQMFGEKKKRKKKANSTKKQDEDEQAEDENIDTQTTTAKTNSDATDKQKKRTN